MVFDLVTLALTPYPNMIIIISKRCVSYMHWKEGLNGGILTICQVRYSCGANYILIWTDYNKTLKA